jgi:DNA-binding transcriptional MocR family regulator
MPSTNPDKIDLSRAIPPSPAELTDGLRRVLRQLADDDIVSDCLRRNRVGGSEADREAAALWLSQRLGSVPSINRVIVSNGTQSLLGLILFECVGSGGTLLAEALTYPVLVPLAKRFGVRVHPVAIDDDGIIPEAFEALCKQTSATALFCNPTVQNPTTSVLPEVRRIEIVAIARRHNIVIIEDDVLGSLHGPSPAPLARIGPDIVWHTQSLSKCVALGLKIAYAVGPTAAATEKLIQSVSNHSFWFPSALAAEVATRLIIDGGAGTICRSIAKLAELRLSIAAECLGAFGFSGKPGGLHIWLPLPPPWTAHSFVSAASSVGVLIRPASMFAVEDPRHLVRTPEAVRIALTTPATDAELRRGLQRLSALLEESAEGVGVGSVRETEPSYGS